MVIGPMLVGAKDDLVLAAIDILNGLRAGRMARPDGAGKLP